MRLFHSSLLLTLLLSSFWATSTISRAQEATDQVDPEGQVTPQSQKEGQPVRGKNWMVVSANPHASEAGAKILRSGGNAIDAMVAVQTTLGLTEPQSSGLGGGGILVYWDNKEKRLTTFDGRETAPLGVDPKLFIGEDGKPLQFFDAVVSGLSVGVPGLPKLLHEVHGKYGKAEWSSLMDHAINLAENGFKISPRLAGLVANRGELLQRFEGARSYFFDEQGNPKQAGTLLKNPDYAKTLRAFQKEGADTFYRGDIARKIVDAVQSVPVRPGSLSLEDLKIYEVRERAPVCVDYRHVEFCSAGPPSSGGVAVAQILGILESFDMAALGPENVQSVQLIGDATRLAFADRARYLADSDHVVIPLKGLLKKSYLKDRAKLLKAGKRLEVAEAGEPSFDHALNFADDQSLELPSTTHFTIRDDEGNIVSMTSTIETAFGSTLMVGGFLLNNQLTDFSFITNVDNRPVANSVAPGKRPRSSITPSILFKDGSPYIALGSPGGSRIIPYVAKSVIAMIDWGMNIQEAFEQPHFANRFGTFAFEDNTAAVGFDAPLQKLGYQTVIIPLNSGLHGIVINEDGLEGGVDPRREGVAIGG